MIHVRIQHLFLSVTTGSFSFDSLHIVALRLHQHRDFVLAFTWSLVFWISGSGLSHVHILHSRVAVIVVLRISCISWTLKLSLSPWEGVFLIPTIIEWADSFIVYVAGIAGVYPREEY